MSKLFSSISLVVFVLFISNPGVLLAEKRNPVPRNSIQKLLGEIKQIKFAEDLPARLVKDNRSHSQNALELLNMAEISKKALGKHWKKITRQEQKQFQTLLGELFVHVAFPSSAKFFAELDLVYGETREDKQAVVVPLTVVHDKEGEVDIDFKLTQSGDKWQVVDVILDGVSMRNNLRSQFYKIIKRKNFNELIRKMEKKLTSARS